MTERTYKKGKGTIQDKIDEKLELLEFVDIDKLGLKDSPIKLSWRTMIKMVNCRIETGDKFTTQDTVMDLIEAFTLISEDGDFL